MSGVRAMTPTLHTERLALCTQTTGDFRDFAAFPATPGGIDCLTYRFTNEVQHVSY